MLSMWNAVSAPKNIKSKNSKTASIVKKFDANGVLAQIEPLGERILCHGEMEDLRQYQRLVRDLSHWAAIKDNDEEDEEANLQYVDPFAPVLQRAIERRLIRLHVKLKELDEHSNSIAVLIDEIQSNLRDLIALKQK